ncbi:MAG: ATP-binding protein, partial [Rhodocyclales bacterium]|nr:ATP-binding protein [Rhodocyclales bacterium]
MSIPLVAVVGFGIYSDMQQTISHTKASLRTVASMMVSNTGGKIANARQILERLAVRPVIKQVDPKNCDGILKDLLALNPDYANVTYTDMDGVAVCSAVPQPDGKPVNVGKAPWYQALLKDRRFIVGDPFFGPITGKWVSVLSAPIWSERHEMVGGVQLPLDINSYDPHIPAQFLPTGSRYGFLGENGILIWRNVDPEGIIGTRLDNVEAARRVVEVRNGEFESVGSDGVTRFYSVLAMPQTGWIAFVGIPEREVYAAATQRAITAAIIAVGAIVLLMLLALAITRRIARPIAELERTACGVQSGDLGPRASIEGPSEVAEVAKAFNAMTDRIQASTRRLEAEVSAHKQAEDQLHLQALVLDQIQDHITVTDLDGTVTYVNQAELRGLKHSRQDIVGRHVSAYGEDPSADAAQEEIVELTRSKGEWHGQVINFQPDGSPIVVALRTSLVRSETGEPIAMVGIGTDVTARKQAEAELEQHRHHLEELVFSRTAELAQARDAAEAANRAKSVFLANMSHELRTPMNGIMGMTNLMLRRATDPQQIDWLNKSMGAARHLLTVINDILDISQIEADRLTLEEKNFSLSQIIGGTLQMQEAAVQAKGLSLSCEIDPTLPAVLCGDAMRLRQILLNFISNAIKFSEHGQVAVRVHAMVEDSHSVLLRLGVSDQGIGLSLEQKNRLFQAFTQVDGSLTRKYGGTGLGLIISRRIALLMGGDAGVISEEGQGSTFWATVRLRRAVAGPQSDSSAPSEPARETLARQFAG